ARFQDGPFVAGVGVGIQQRHRQGADVLQGVLVARLFRLAAAQGEYEIGQGEERVTVRACIVACGPCGAGRVERPRAATDNREMPRKFPWVLVGACVLATAGAGWWAQGTRNAAVETPVAAVAPRADAVPAAAMPANRIRESSPS